MNKTFKLAVIALLIAYQSLSSSVEINILEDFEAGSRAANVGNHEKALIFFNQCAEKKDPRCYFALSTYYYFGDGGIKQNYETAYQYAKQGADGGYGPAEFMTAIMLRDGHGVEANNEKALEYLESAAYKCVSQAQEDFGNYLLSFEDMNMWFNAAIWLRLAAENGSDSALNTLNEVFKDAPQEFNDEVTRLKKEVEGNLTCETES